MYTNRNFSLLTNDTLPDKDATSYDLNTSRVALIVVLEGEITASYALKGEEKEVLMTKGFSILTPPNTLIQLKREGLLKKAHWVILEIPINFVNQTIIQFDERCRANLEENKVWELGFEPIHCPLEITASEVLSRLIALFKDEKKKQDIFIELAMQELILRYLQGSAKEQIHLIVARENKNPSIEVVLDYIKEHIHEPISIETLTDIANMSRAAFFRSFKESLELSPVDYINRERVALAKDRLVDISNSVTDICYELGYNHMTYFIRVFKKYEGITPKQFQIQQNKKETVEEK